MAFHVLQLAEHNGQYPIRCSVAAAAGAGPLSLEAALAQGGALVPEFAPPPILSTPTDLLAAETDPVGALEAAIQADKPK